MNAATRIQAAMPADAILLASRLLLALLFIHEGVFLVMNFGPASAGMAKLGVPPLILGLTTAMQLVAGLAIASGWHARLGAAALGLFCLATAILFHDNLANRDELLQFEKDFAIAGGMFALMASGPGRWSLERFRRARGASD
jgi:putative oxidoreductase